MPFEGLSLDIERMMLEKSIKRREYELHSISGIKSMEVVLDETIEAAKGLKECRQISKTLKDYKNMINY